MRKNSVRADAAILLSSTRAALSSVRGTLREMQLVRHNEYIARMDHRLLVL